MVMVIVMVMVMMRVMKYNLNKTSLSKRLAKQISICLRLYYFADCVFTERKVISLQVNALN